MEKIKLKDNLNWQQKKNAVETSLIMGFHSTTAKFPIASREMGIDVPEKLEDLRDIYTIKDKKCVEKYTSSTKAAKPILEMDWRKKKGLETIFTKGFFLKDENLDQLPDKLDFRISIPRNCSLSVLISACNFAFRFGMETTAFEGPIIAKENWKGNLLIFEEDDNCGMELIEEEKNIAIRIYGKGQELEEFSTKICETFPLLGDNRTWIEQLQYMTDSFAMENIDGQLSYLAAYKKELQSPVTAYISPGTQENVQRIQSVFPDVEFRNYKSNKKIYEKAYDIPWEVDVFKKILEEKVYNIIKPHDRVEIYGALSEDINIRGDLLNEINGKLKKLKVESKSLQIISAYKQGFSWIEEIILPKLEKEKINNIDIYFKPFLPKGETQWVDEDGATPSYHNIDVDNPDKWLDLPIRYLQELYPIDDILSLELKVPKDKIKFIAYEGKEDITYEVKAFNDNGGTILKSSYKATYSERPYLDEYPQMGKVHPSTGFIKVIINGEKIVNQSIKTDLENIWDIYQKDVLPQCKEFIESKIDKNLSIDQQPLFSQLRMEVNASEPNYSLPIREDMISSLNSFHEDMYFVGADYFKNYGMKEHNILLDAPGLILPVIKQGLGKPEFRVILYDQLRKSPSIKGKNKDIDNLIDKKQIELYIKKLSYKNKKILVTLNTNIEEEALIESYMELLEQDYLNSSTQFKGIDILEINSRVNSFKALVKEKQEIIKNLNILDIDLLEDTLIGYEDYINIIEKLKYVPGIKVYKVATSYLGRDIYAIELVSEGEGYRSRTKRINNLPSEIINCRHHANEVSSTNAAFMLLKKLLTEDKYKNLEDMLNLVIVPMENVDGTAIHYELQKDNPKWKLHVARFNAVGKEFYYEHFDPHTIHTEAMALTKLWEKYLPDIIVDNHGVPSHEWEQQFSGYTSPSYKGFWLPRSLLYGYFWTIENIEYKGNYIVNKKVEEVIAKKISQDTEITMWNKEWIEVFEKYAHQWLPKLFPADYYKDMINYWISFEFDPNHRYPSIRFPWITTVAYTSEVADETAQGEYLNLCARTHLAHDVAVIEMLMNAKCLFESEFEISKDKISVRNIRHRPLLV